MRFVTFRYDGNLRIGAFMDDRVIDLNYACVEMLESQEQLRAKQIAEAYVPANMVEFLQGGEPGMKMAKEAIDFALNSGQSFSRKVVLPVSEVRLEAPVQNPAKMICVGHNYREHILEMGRELPPYPVIFAKFANTIIGPQDDIPFYPVSEQLDYEAEFAFVIGKRARNVSADQALDYVAGYTIANDVTYRDIQRRTIEWLQGKTVEGSAPMGPWLVSGDEIGDPAGLEVVLEVNGEERQRSNTANLVFTVPYLVEFLSGLMTLEPGDVILTGTPGGVGVARNPQVFLKDGDIVRIEIDRIGALENRVKKVEPGVIA
ncbi:fumarylacetoacetate hydrolase family protein [Brevibacillus choshinensis]|uniref:fumarylacetoacetate hydrolase family protein n=1 Tax=Brevibacillus choshinensis TaxID=54911 RepID=UPI002E226A0D|nr:fumarylacetoacetate hydrolase family protein [Brevibacillus choshinensis]